jgi:hypothetical protein
MRRLLTLLAAALLVGAFVLPGSAAAQSPCVGVDTALATIAMPAGSWTLGAHSYKVRFTYDNGASPPQDYGPVTFTVETGAPAFAGPVFLRYDGLSSTAGPPTSAGTRIQPGQRTVFYGGHLLFIGWDFATRNEARDFWSTSGVSFSWDGGPWVAGHKLPVTSACASGFSTMSNEKFHEMGQLRRHYQ